MHLQIKSCIRTDLDSINDRESGACVASKILYHEYDDELDDVVEQQIGEIVAYQIFGIIDELILWADSISQDLLDAILWLQELCKQRDEVAGLPQYTFIEKVEIEPAWRGRGIALLAVAAFLEVFSREGFIFLKPAPLKMLEEPEDQKQAIEWLRSLWEKVGLDHYDSRANYLWNPLWDCPSELAGTEDILP